MQTRGVACLPAVVLILVVLAAGLLLVGYGVPVGVGLIIGVVLGGAVGLLGVLWVGAGTGRSITIGSSGFGTSSQGPIPEIPEWVRQGERAMVADLGPLVRVVPVGAAVEVSGVRVELTVIELRQMGGVALAAVVGELTGPRLGPFVRVTVGDDIGTQYVAGSSGGSSGGFAVRYEVRFVPAVPAVASGLVIRFEEFADPFPVSGPHRFVGPWEFVVDLPRPLQP